MPSKIISIGRDTEIWLKQISQQKKSNQYNPNKKLNPKKENKQDIDSNGYNQSAEST